MAARRIFSESTSGSRPRDSIIDEIPPEETEKMGYVWVVKGTLSEEEEKEAAKFGSLPDIGTLPVHEISSCNLAKEKVHELIIPFDQWGKAPVQPDPNIDRRTTDDFKLYIPSFVRQMHSLFSRPPELIRKDTIALQQILEQMPMALADRPSYITNASRLLDLTSRPIVQNGEPRSPSIISEKEQEKDKEVEQPIGKEEIKDRDLHAMYADPEIEPEKIEEPPEQQEPKRKLVWPEPPDQQVPKRELIWGEPSIQRRAYDEIDPSLRGRKYEGNEPFIREYILRKVAELEHRLRRVNNDISGSKERQDQFKLQLYEMEILKLVEKISKADVPSETDVTKLEYLTDQLKIAQGKKTEEPL